MIGFISHYRPGPLPLCAEEGACYWVSDCRVCITMNSYEAIVRGAAAIQSAAILSSLFRVLPHEIVEEHPFSAKISCDGSEPSAGGE